MADIAHGITPDTEYLLDGLQGEWEAGLRTVANWSQLSDYEQLVFVETWAIARGCYHELVERADAGQLTPEQCRRFDALREWISTHRAEIEVVLEESAL